jgi:hypothetical protein
MLDKKLLIVFRHYREDLYANRSRDPNKKRPNWFSNLICFRSIVKSVQTSELARSSTILVWYDGSEEDLRTDPITNELSAAGKILPINLVRKDYKELGNNAGERLSWQEMAIYSLTEHASDYIYLVENDYLHKDLSMLALKEILTERNDISYVSLADHRDYYHLPCHVSRVSHLGYTRNFLFREVATTTGTFGARTEDFIGDIQIFLQEKTDYPTFNVLTGIKGRKLVAVLPGMAAHCMQNLLPPAVEWSEVAQWAMEPLIV